RGEREGGGGVGGGAGREGGVSAPNAPHRRRAAPGRFSFAPADLMRATLGIEPGAVTPFAAMNDSERRVSVVLDAALMRHETVNCHPLVNTMTTSIARADLVRFLEATGHPPRIEAVAEQQAPARD